MCMSTRAKVGWLIATLLVLLWSLFPVFSILMTSFKTQDGLFSGTLLPPEWTWENYAEILAPGGSAQGLFLPALRNSIGISLIATFIAVDRKSTRLNSSHVAISYTVFCLIK